MKIKCQISPGSSASIISSRVLVISTRDLTRQSSSHMDRESFSLDSREKKNSAKFYVESVNL